MRARVEKKSSNQSCKQQGEQRDLLGKRDKRLRHLHQNIMLVLLVHQLLHRLEIQDSHTHAVSRRRKKKKK